MQDPPPPPAILIGPLATAPTAPAAAGATWPNVLHTRIADVARLMGPPPWSKRLIADERQLVTLIATPGGGGNRPHWHRDFDEWWVVLAGRLEWELTGGIALQARQALLAGRSPRVSGQTLPVATRPSISSCAARAGKKVLNTPIGRLLKPGGAWSTKGSMQSYQESVTRGPAATTVSVVVDQGPPRRAKAAATTGSVVSAKAGKSRLSMVLCSHRATAMLSP